MSAGADWDDLPLSERAKEAVHAIGWKRPTAIQAAVVPQLKMGRDVIGRAQTGSGKTAAFGLLMADTVKAPGLQALVLAPTRELATQIAADLNALAKDAPFRAVAIHGGVPYDPQLAALRDPGTTCAVATTGRLLDLLARRQVDLSRVAFVVIDEADRMLDLGFLPEVERVLKLVPGARQTALFTATLPKKVAQLAHKYMAHPREIEVGSATPAEAQHHRVDVPSIHKGAALRALLRTERPSRAIVFVRTREGAQRLAWELEEAGFDAAGFHGDLSQREREEALAAFERGDATILVATDVAARGLDIPRVTHVVQHDVPEEAEQYVHRAGRTARAGRSGRVFTIVTENDGAAVAAAERVARVKLQPYRVTLDVGGEQVELGAKPVPPKPEMRGGYARGAPRKREQAPRTTPAQRLARKGEADEQADREGEYDLPPSRRARRDRED